MREDTGKGMGPGPAVPGESPPAHEGPVGGRRLQRSESSILGDGQLGGDAIDRQGAERANPEGSHDISNEDLVDRP